MWDFDETWDPVKFGMQRIRDEVPMRRMGTRVGVDLRVVFLGPMRCMGTPREVPELFGRGKTMTDRIINQIDAVFPVEFPQQVGAVVIDGSLAEV